MIRSLEELPLEVVRSAWLRVRRHPTPGVDRVGVDEVERHLEPWLRARHRAITTGSWTPSRLLRIGRRKADGSIRTLGLPTLADRTIVGAVHEAIARRIEPRLHPGVHGYRLARSPRTAVADLVRQAGARPWLELLHADLAQMFDTLPHGLVRRGARLVDDPRWHTLVEATLRRWAVSPGVGVPQGSALSPLLANAAMCVSLDRDLDRGSPGGPIVGWVRYGDDLVLLSDRPGGATRAALALDGWVRSLGMRLAAHKTTVARPRSVPCGAARVLGLSVRVVTDGGLVRLEVEGGSIGSFRLR